MSVYIFPPGFPSSHFVNLADALIKSCESRPPQNADHSIRELGPNDHVVLFMSSKILTLQLRDVPCRVSIILREPPAVQNRYYRLIPFFAKRFHRVLTHNRALANLIPNARLVPHGGRWARQVPVGIPNKTKRVALIASSKHSAPGHVMRHRVAKWSIANVPDLELLGRGYKPLDDKADGHVPYMFSVVIENSQEPGYFTEKIIDSFLCGSIPIYWGAPDIADYFNPAGIIQCDDEKSLQVVVQSVSAEDFQKRLVPLSSNKELASFYADFRSIAAEVLESDQSFEPLNS